MEYSYNDGDLYYFMDPESYELVPFEEYEYEEDDILEEQVKKRIRQKGSVTKENFQKYYGYFARKGFNSGKILDLLRKYMED